MRISNISVTVDILIFKESAPGFSILLIQRKNEPFQHLWALPGGFVDEDEDLKAAAIRELYEETGLKESKLKQLKAFGTPYRDPRGHTVSIAYYGFTDESAVAVGADDAEKAEWFDIDNLPALAFDHSEIISFAKAKIGLV